MKRYPAVEEVWLEVLEMEGMVTTLWMEDMVRCYLLLCFGRCQHAFGQDLDRIGLEWMVR